MSTISSIDRLLQTMQTRGIDKRRHTQGSLGTATQKNASADACASNNIDAWVLAQLQAISRDDPQRRRRAFRIFLQGEILKRLGSQLSIGSALEHLTDKTQAAMESDADLRLAMEQAADILLQRTDSA